MKSRAAPWLALLLVWAAAGAAACSGLNAPGGLVVAMNIDPSLQDAGATGLTVTIGSTDGGATYRDVRYAISDEDGPNAVHFPAAFAIDSNGDKNAAVAFTLDLLGATGPLAVNQFKVYDIPVSTFVELQVLFAASCPAAGVTADGEIVACPVATADGGQACSLVEGQWLCDAGTLGASVLDAGWPLLGPEPGPEPGLDASDAAPVDATLVVESGPLTISCDAPCAPGFVCVQGSCVPVSPSCAGGGPGAGLDCGRIGTDDCCASDEVPGGAFYRNYDGRMYFDMSQPATVSQFRLDRYEVTVGRFRQFINTITATTPAWTPAAGSGKHVHLNGGNGLTNGGDAGVIYEPGWDPAWDPYLPPSASEWTTQLQSCNGDSGLAASDWTASPGENEYRPIQCLSWYAAYAFCIWDGGFLPSDTEWDYAAAGGGDNQYEYAWGNSVPGDNDSLAIYDCFYPPAPTGTNFGCEGVLSIAPVGTAQGQATWGQFDLTGNVFEYDLDYGPTSYPVPCVNCSNTVSGTQRTIRGGGWDANPAQIYNSVALVSPPENTHSDVGVRCARTPTYTSGGEAGLAAP